VKIASLSMWLALDQLSILLSETYPDGVIEKQIEFARYW
jgi:hypothetical protein